MTVIGGKPPIVPGPVSVFYGPVSAKVGQGLPFPATPILWLTASQEPGPAAGTVLIHLSCSPAPTTDFSGGIAAYVENYNGNPATVEIFQDTNRVLSFILKRTGELVTFTVAAVNAAGQISNQTAGVNMTLNGILTPPAKLTNVIASEGSALTDVKFQAGPDSGITTYRLYRGAFGGVFGGAALIASLAATDQAAYVLSDAVRNRGVNTYQWYVTAVNVAGEGPASDAVLPFVKW